MGITKIVELDEFGQSVWLDYISRSLIKTGKLKELIGIGLLGMTSNPTIFDKAISSGTGYDGQIAQLSKKGMSTFEIYDDLTVSDIQDAADTFKPIFEKTNMLDGYVSLEINPKLAYKIKETIDEGKRLYQKVNRPNLMLKVPATNEGCSAVEELTSCGINVNVTLIFSQKQYEDTAFAYMKGIKRYLGSNSDASKIRSVASVFVSRVDTVVDKALEKLAAQEKDKKSLGNLTSLKGKAAVANSALIYKKYLDIFSSDDFNNLQNKGVNIQRVLWGSTSTKNPAYSDIKYVTELIGKDTVNTMPENTFNAFLDHGGVKGALTADTFCAENIIANLDKIRIKVDVICEKLLADGVVAFERSFESLLNTINSKKNELCLKK